MYPTRFSYHRPPSVDTAVAMLQELGEDAVVMAGGQSLIPLMKLRLSSPAAVIDISTIGGMSGVEVRGDDLLIGALVRHVELEERTDLPPELTMIHEAAHDIGDAQVRNLGTLGGALGEADPAGDWGPVVLALDGTVSVTGAGGRRDLDAGELFEDAYATSLAHDDIIERVSLRVPRGAGSTFLKLERRAGSFAIVSAAVWVRMRDDTVADCGIALGGVGMTPIRAHTAEQVITGSTLSPEVIAEAAEAVQAQIDPVNDIRGGADYKRSLMRPTLARSLATACERARRANSKEAVSG